MRSPSTRDGFRTGTFTLRECGHSKKPVASRRLTGNGSGPSAGPCTRASDGMRAWARGRLSNPVPGAVHYWAGSQRVSKDAHQAAKPSLPVVYYKGKKENVFFGASNTHKTGRSWVKPVGAEPYVQQGPMLAGMGGISSPAAAALVGVGVLWWFLRKT